MYVVDTYKGNKYADEVLSAAIAAEAAETVTVDDTQRRRSRVRTETDAGTEVGIVVGRELRAGDVLASESGEGPLIEVALEPIEAVVVDLADSDADSDADTDTDTGDVGVLVMAVALGHAAGNRHWDMAIREDAVIFPASDSDARIDATIDPHLPAGATVERESISPAIFDGDGPGVADHSHSHDGGDDHAHSHDYSHSHDDHGADHTHSHGDHEADHPYADDEDGESP